MKLIVGLGNPGREYAQTRHNVGWMALDRLAERAGWNVRVRGRDASASVRGRYGELDLELVKPLTFMNDSGIAVRKVLARERVPLDAMLVVVDDFALPFGRLRLRGSGSAGGHNGLRSIIGELGTERFARLRVGIGEPRRAAVDHVLSRFTADERDHLPAVLDAAVDAIATWALEGTEAAASRWNGWSLEEVEADGGQRGEAKPEVPADRATGPRGGGAGPGGGPRRPGGPMGGRDGGTQGPHADESTGRDASSTERGPDGNVIVRTRTGWRKLLPGADRGETGEERR